MLAPTWPPPRPNLVKAQATAEQTSADYQRNAALAKEGVISQQQLDLAKANADTAQAGVNAAQAQVTQAEAQVSQKAAAVSVAQTNLDHTIIRSPIDGTVVARSIDVGQTVAASLQAPTLFSIAQDLTKMQVYAATDESDVGQIKVGQPITFKVDAFPARHLPRRGFADSHECHHRAERGDLQHASSISTTRTPSCFRA